MSSTDIVFRISTISALRSVFSCMCVTPVLVCTLYQLVNVYAGEFYYSDHARQLNAYARKSRSVAAFQIAELSVLTA